MIGANHGGDRAYQAFHEAKQADAKTAAAVDSAALGQYAVTDLSIERCDADGP